LPAAFLFEQQKGLIESQPGGRLSVLAGELVIVSANLTPCRAGAREPSSPGDTSCLKPAKGLQPVGGEGSSPEAHLPTRQIPSEAPGLDGRAASRGDAATHRLGLYTKRPAGRSACGGERSPARNWHNDPPSKEDRLPSLQFQQPAAGAFLAEGGGPWAIGPKQQISVGVRRDWAGARCAKGPGARSGGVGGHGDRGLPRKERSAPTTGQ